jgi:hypothetical protein
MLLQLVSPSSRGKRSRDGLWHGRQGCHPSRLRDLIASPAGTKAGLCAALATGLVLVFSGSAHAYAKVAPAPTAGSPGLPDGRVYEEASPPNKNGNSAGQAFSFIMPHMLAEPGGDGVVYNQEGGAIGDAPSGIQSYAVAKRSSGGWASYGATPQTTGESAKLNLEPAETGFSADLTRDVFSDHDLFLGQESDAAALLYDIPSATTTWLDPPPATGEGEARFAAIAGYSTDMSTFYFRTPTGFYEWHEGALSVAGVLPDGSLEPAAQAAGLPREAGEDNEDGAVFQGAELRNEVSEDGEDAFFVSAGANPQLYVRETAPDGSQRTVLASEDALLPAVGGLPAPAPHGVLPIAFPAEGSEGEVLSAALQGGTGEYETGEGTHSTGDLYASPDGSRAFFASSDQLTSAAPTGGGMYEFDTVTNSLTYLRGVGASPILVSSKDGSDFIFNAAGGTGALSLWSEAGGEGGTVTQVEPYPVGGEARATPDGSVFAFESAAEFPGFNNGGEHIQLHGEGGPFRNQQVYRYDVAENSLSCVSCPPRGVTPTGNAYMSHDEGYGEQNGGNPLFANRGISEDGSRIFFDSPDPLVPQDTNTAAPTPIADSDNLQEHDRDVYEWENGRLFLISTGTSHEDSYFGDNSASGNDVFFSTTQGLSPGDTDEAYDVYDARVPRPGDNPPAVPAPCEGDVCQGPPSEPALLSPPASATFNGLGNPTSPPAATPPAPKKTTKKATKCPKGKARDKKGQCIKTKPRKHKSNKKGRA